MKQQLNKRSHEFWNEGHYIGRLEGRKGRGKQCNYKNKKYLKQTLGHFF